MKKYLFECKECGFLFIAFNDEDTYHEKDTGHKRFKNLGEVYEGPLAIVIPTKPVVSQ
jgi:hypothetical protein